MPACTILDTFPAFLEVWREVQHTSISDQIDAWHSQYMAYWPELRKKQLENYASEGANWREIAAQHVFPALPERLPAIQTAHDNLLGVCEQIYGHAVQVLGYDRPLVCVIYVGIGCGAGWADSYADKPAVLFGLENIAEEGWEKKTTLSGLMAHELGHLIHFEWREQENLDKQESPWWQLYSEGFAQCCESLILGKPSWHMKSSLGEQWQMWCQENLQWLAAEFLRRIDCGDDIRPFFGSWFNLRGYKQTGYYLGQWLILDLLKQMSLREVALLDDVEGSFRELLNRMAHP